MTCGYLTGVTLLGLALGATALGQSDLTLNPQLQTINCDERGTFFCLDRYNHVNYEGEYVGHDEPSVLFYSSVAGSGNQSRYTVILPKDPQGFPTQDGSGPFSKTWNFQLHPAFWFGMALCDTQSAPAPNISSTCVPDSDSNIADSTSPKASDYIGKHSGTAFMELQFYPPG